MTTSTTTRRQSDLAAIDPADLAEGDYFLHQYTGRTFVFEAHRPGAGDDDLAVSAFPVLDSGRVSTRGRYLYLDPTQLVNLGVQR